MWILGLKGLSNDHDDGKENGKRVIRLVLPCIPFSITQSSGISLLAEVSHGFSFLPCRERPLLAGKSGIYPLKQLSHKLKQNVVRPKRLTNN